MEKNVILQEIQNQKELAIFFDMLNSLPVPQKRSNKLESNEKIPVILSSDDNYSCFVATTGVSILYNTHSFVEFYVLSEGISEKNKQLIRKSYETITPHFSLNFIECDSAKVFSSIKLLDNYYVTLSTCNRLLVPKLLPDLKRAIYLDVDLIVLDDIKKLWDENLDGHIFGCVPLYYDRFSTVEFLKKCAGISDNSEYCYFNSGVMLIDYDEWRRRKGTNEELLRDLFALLDKCDTKVTPDEMILNRFAWENGGYKILPHKYNTHTKYTYQFLKKNEKILSEHDKWTLAQFEKLIKYNHYEYVLNETDESVIHHYFGAEKPWFHASSSWFTIPLHEHFEDFWFYAKLTLFFNQIKRGYISKHMYLDYSKIDELDVRTNLSEILDKLAEPKLKRKKRKYKILSLITFGKWRKKYQEKYNRILAHMKRA